MIDIMPKERMVKRLRVNGIDWPVNNTAETMKINGKG